MAKFEKDCFEFSGGYLSYNDPAHKRNRFVARFKWSRGPVTRTQFVKTLIKHYDTENYFRRSLYEAPLMMLMNDGILVFNNAEKKFVLDGKVLK